MAKQQLHQLVRQNCSIHISLLYFVLPLRNKNRQYRQYEFTRLTVAVENVTNYLNVLDITTLQHGFQRNRSCATQLLAVVHEIGKNLDENVQTDVLHVDFAKAFDVVDHQILLKKLNRFWCSRPHA